MQHLQDQARAARSRKEYTTAVKLYTRAITRSPSAQLHDDRADCYENLNDLSLALKDAKAAIQLAKNDPIGYLRAGKLLTRMKQESVALEIYAHGLRSVKHTGTSFNTLKRIHDETLARVAPVNSIDPLTVFPIELAISILEYLNFKQIVRSCSVSKTWNNFIRANPQLWTHLDLRGARRKVKHSFIVSAVKTCPDMQHITLDYLSNFDMSIEMLTRLKSLKKITLLRIPRLGDTFELAIRKMPHLEQLHIESEEYVPRNVERAILESCANLVSFKAWTGTWLDIRDEQVANLRSLDIRILAMDKISLRNAYPALKYLKLEAEQTSNYIPDFSSLSSLLTLELCTQHIKVEDLHLPQSLETLIVRTKSVILSNLFPVRAQLFQPEILRNLKHLELWTIAFGSLAKLMNGLLASTEHDHPKLNHLVISNCDFQRTKADDFVFESFCEHPSIRSVETLGLPEALALDDSLLTRLIKDKALLTRLDVSRSNVTGHGLHKAIDSVKELIITDCRKVSSDFIDLAKSRGVRVRRGKKDSF